MHAMGSFATAACTAQLSVHGSHPQEIQRPATVHHLRRHMRAISSRLQSSLSPQPRRTSGLDHPQQEAAALREAFNRVAAFLLAVCIHLGPAPASQALSLASVSEDALLQAARSLEAKVGSTWSALREALPSLPAADDSAAAAQAVQAGQDLVHEVFETVDKNFADARGSGFDHARWARLRDEALSRPLRDRTAAYAAVREMLAYLQDPYSRLVAAQDFAAMLKYDVSGVGLNLGTLDELRTKTGLEPAAAGGAAPEQLAGPWVVGVMRGSTADQSGVRQGDQVLAVDGGTTQGRSPFEVASLLQGPEAQPASGRSAGGSGGAAQALPPAVRLQVRHLGGDTEEVALQRPAKVAKPSPVSARLERRQADGTAVGYLKLTSFEARAQRDLAAAVRQLQSQGATRLVLDLRGNRGGLVTAGIEVARLFLDGDALIVRTEGKARSNAPITAPGPALAAAPLAVLVDSHTASASEILAGALRDNCRAVLVGGRTYGKGLIQSVYELSDGSGLVLTVGKYLTPAGTDIDREGISPDFNTMPSAQAADDAVAACKVQPTRR